MIEEVHLRRFKKYEDISFKLKANGVSICAGQNGSGKSTLLHALAVWAFGVMVIRQFKGELALREGYEGQGAGLSKDDFTPINIPDLRHLWHNLKSQIPGEGYSLAITAKWRQQHEENQKHQEKRLTIAFSLVQDRLYVKAVDSNLQSKDDIPTIVYLPPVAGIDAREEYATSAKRMTMLGRGLAGSVLRNYLRDLEAANRRIREEKKGTKKKISAKDLKEIRATDAWERLNEIMREVFGFELKVSPFDPNFHTVLKVDAIPRVRRGNKWEKAGPPRDLMVEGAGAQQWLTVFTFALDSGIDVLLLDEPDAHLFSRLKVDMVDRLREIAADGRQILMATHATEILKRHTLERIMTFDSDSPKYLENEVQRAKLISGLGDDYAPLIEKARQSRAILFVENESDARILQAWCKTLDLRWPENLAVHGTTDSHKDRLKFYRNLLGAIDGLRAVSLCDRDNLALSEIDPETLIHKGTNTSGYPDFKALTWRRREIENYALVADALVAYIGDQEVVRQWWEQRGWQWPQNMEIEEHLLDCDVKEKLHNLLGSQKKLKEFLRQLRKEHIHRDIRIVIREIAMMSS